MLTLCGLQSLFPFLLLAATSGLPPVINSGMTEATGAGFGPTYQSHAKSCDCSCALPTVVAPACATMVKVDSILLVETAQCESLPWHPQERLPLWSNRLVSVTTAKSPSFWPLMMKANADDGDGTPGSCLRCTRPNR